MNTDHSSKNECKVAATALGQAWTDHAGLASWDWKRRPLGCILHRNKLLWNTWNSNTKGLKNKFVCKATPTSVLEMTDESEDGEIEELEELEIEDEVEGSEADLEQAEETEAEQEGADELEADLEQAEGTEANLPQAGDPEASSLLQEEANQ